MSEQARQTEYLAAQILSGLLSNPHIYAKISDEGANAPQEQELIEVAIAMAENVITKVAERVTIE